ncbi:MAG: sigma-70 family RNA polymerase sigma factor [Johnsonella sp.]|nr:sigma-70 family RNA polymerase sigma factor [Johnsonella sp.]
MEKKEYSLYVNGEEVKVSEDIYKTYWKITEHERYLQRKDWKHKVLPFSSLDYDRNFSESIIDEKNDVEKITEMKIKIEKLYKALNELTEEERELIISIFFIEESLYSIGQRKNRSYTAIGNRRNRIVGKLRRILDGKM